MEENTWRSRRKEYTRVFTLVLEESSLLLMKEGALRDISRERSQSTR
jgi:hypothetical protein